MIAPLMGNNDSQEEERNKDDEISSLLKNNNRVSINLDKNNQLAYLYNLKKLISYKKIVFDIDYNWNIIENKDYLDDVERVKKVFSQFECEYIFNKNILSISKTLQKEL